MYGKGPGEVDGAPEFEALANVVHRGRRIDRGVYSSGKGPRTDALLFINISFFILAPQGPRWSLEFNCSNSGAPYTSPGPFPS